jgi:hypothetical protein
MPVQELLSLHGWNDLVKDTIELKTSHALSHGLVISTRTIDNNTALHYLKSSRG